MEDTGSGTGVRMGGEDGRTNALVLASRMLEKLRHAQAVVIRLSLRRDERPQRSGARMLDLESLPFQL